METQAHLNWISRSDYERLATELRNLLRGDKPWSLQISEAVELDNALLELTFWYSDVTQLADNTRLGHADHEDMREIFELSLKDAIRGCRDLNSMITSPDVHYEDDYHEYARCINDNDTHISILT